MNMTILQFIVAILGILCTNGAFFYSINRKLKKVELEDKRVDIIKKQDEEWRDLYLTTNAKAEKLEEQLQEVRAEKEELQRQNGLLEMKTLQLNWYRCTVNNCPNRRPPHVFDIDGNELEA